MMALCCLGILMALCCVRISVYAGVLMLLGVQSHSEREGGPTAQHQTSPRSPTKAPTTTVPHERSLLAVNVIPEYT